MEEPLYQQIADDLASAIGRGVFPPGARLPTVRELARERGVDVGTISRAYQLLARRGLVEAHARRGTLVRSAAAASAPPPAPKDTILLAGSHDFGLDVLARQLRERGLRLELAPLGSTGGLRRLGDGQAHLAGSHLLDDDGQGYNHDAVRRLLGGRPARLITLAEREQGLIVPRGNPRRLSGPADLGQAGLRLVNRQAGSGTRALLDRLLARVGLRGEEIAGYEREAQTHLEVAAAVAGGSADVGLGLAAAAQALDLGFIPLARERYDLVLLAEQQAAPWFGPLLETVAGLPFRTAVEALGGYDGAYSGWIRRVE